jgi:hypothetical protein
MVRRGVILVDAIVGAVLLGMTLAALLTIAGRAVRAQGEGQRMATAAALIDEQLNLVLARGPDNYASRFPVDGPCEAPFDDYTYRIEISGGQSGVAYDVVVTVQWAYAGRLRSASVSTKIAPREGDEPDPERAPAEPVERFF